MGVQIGVPDDTAAVVVNISLAGGPAAGGDDASSVCSEKASRRQSILIFAALSLAHQSCDMQRICCISRCNARITRMHALLHYNDNLHFASILQIPALRLPADGAATNSTKTLSGTLSKASIAAARQATAAVQLPRQARRRIIWDSQLRLRIFWLSVFFATLGKC